MNSIQKRFLYFLLLCIPTRIVFVLLAYFLPEKYLPYLGYVAILPAVAFLIIFIGGFRKTGAEVQGDSIWWNSLRPVHAALYIGFAYLAITKNKRSWIILMLDVIIGVISFLTYHGINNNFSKLS